MNKILIEKVLEVPLKGQTQFSHCLWKQSRACFFSDSMNSKYLISLLIISFLCQLNLIEL